MGRKPLLTPNVNFGPIRLKQETRDDLYRESENMGRSACSVVRDLIELWLKARKRQRKE